jgi:pseudouridine-5'-phosphate glycosidase
MRTRELNIVLEDEVEEALRNNRPVVALESTIIAHGMPYPENLETAHELEKIVRKYGAVPATCAVINGVMKVGLSDAEIEILAKEKCMKLSRRDLATAVFKKANGATTVAATMLLAKMAGIKFFATGGIGGVHRNYQEVLDISSDLLELSKTEVAVVSAGCKSILDIANTLELLETLSVPVIGYRTSSFPAFYCASSDFNVPIQMNHAGEIAEYLHIKWNLGLDGGVLIAQPIQEELAIEKVEMEKYIEEALMEAKRSDISGKELTPFLLRHIVQASGGNALKTNIALAKQNAALAAQIACAYEFVD